MKTCKNCAWYCHADGKCYGNALLLTGAEIGLPIDEKHEACESWAFDGLEDWEREACKPDALVTMEMEMA
jgi:hypothetical protein